MQGIPSATGVAPARFLGSSVLLLALALAAAACNNGSDPTPATMNPQPTMPTPTGGTPDAGSTPDAGTTPDAGPPDTPTPDAGKPDSGMTECTTKMGTLADAFPKCSAELCPAQDSVCVPTDLLMSMMVSQEALDRLANCDDDNKCVPAAYVNTENTVLLAKCTSLNGAEGRCLSVCVGSVMEQASQLPQDSCGEDELCAPCYDPVTGEETGACRQGCDQGPTEPPNVFAKCCEERGRCVTSDLAGDQASNLSQGDCEDGLLCTPSELATPSFKAAMCASLNGAEGRCLSTCLPTVSERLDQLPAEGCGDEERCAPCYDPVSLEETGACRINGDEPVDPPKGFDRCCDDGGACVPPELAGDQADSLGQDVCGAGLLCAPTQVTTPGFKPADCDSLSGFEGRCLPACLGAIADQADILPTDGCGGSEVCAPCYDPISGDDTGACTLNGDAPADPKEVFERCCDTAGTDRGVCVPPALAGDQADSLPQDVCDAASVCAPLEKAQDASFKFPTCQVGGLACLGLTLAGESCAGACVPACIVPEDQAGLLSQGSTCKTGELCAPCVDTDGARTGSCD